jgi:HEAT repeat protein
MWATLFDRVIWIPLRRLKGMSSLDEYFRRDYFSLQAERDELVSKLWKTVFDQIHKRTLWLLDGLDEISGYRHPSGTDLTEIFNSLLSQDNVVITSRPYAANISGLAPFDLELETVGFQPNQVQTYLDKTMKDPVITDQIRSFIQSHWLIQGLVRIPIQLDALCYSWNKSNFRSDALPQTMTEIYQAIELRLWRKDILNLEKSNNGGWLSEAVVQNLRKRVQIQSLVESEMRFLECLAFTGLYSDITEFHQGHRDCLYEQPQFCQMTDDVLDRLSFLRTSDTSSQDKSYHFLHLTFQEFFAAQYYVRCWISESSKPLLCLKGDYIKGKDTMRISPQKFLEKEKYSGRYDVFWRFVIGLLHDFDEEHVSSFLENIEREPRDLLGPAHQRLLMHCFSEIPQSEDSEQRGSSNIFLLRLRERMELGCIKWSDYEDKSLKEVRLCSETEFPEHVLCEMLEKSFLQRGTTHRGKILTALAHRWHMSSKLMGIAAKFMDDDDGHVRRAALFALGAQSPWPAEILQAVTCRLDDEDVDVRRAAIDTLGKQSPWPPEILQAVTCRLADGDWYVRRAAVDALGTQSPWPPEILEAVTCRLAYRDWYVRQAAIDALGTQSPWPPEILQAVTCRLDDDEWYVRRAAIDALGTQTPWSAQILQLITCQLDDKHADVRQASIDALGKQSLWPPGILQVVTCRVDDKHAGVRQAAINALGTQSPWPPEIFQVVTCRLNDDDWYVRRAAIDALGIQSPWPPEILQAVTCRVNDENDEVRRAAVDALGTQSPWPADILQAVTCRLADGNWYVRRAAVDAFGAQSPWPPEILQAVTCRLDDENENVRRAAVDALGTQSPWPPEVLQAVTCRLDDENENVRRATVDALGTQSPWPPEVLQAVTCRLDDENENVRRAAVDALGTQSPWPPEVLQAVTCRVDDENEEVRRAAVDALGTQSPWPPEIFQVVTCRVADGNWYVRRAAIDALGSKSPWPPEILQAVTCRLDDDDWYVRRATVDALGKQSPWSPKIFQVVTCRLDDGNEDVRRAAVDALGTQTPWPPEILKVVMCRLDDRVWTVVSKIEALLWRHDDFVSPFFNLHADAAAGLCKIWAQRSIHETFVCYVCDGNVYFETSDGRRSMPISQKKAQLLKQTLWIATANSPILRLVYRGRTPFSGLKN